MMLRRSTKYILHNATGVSNTVIVYSKHQRGSVILTFLIPTSTAERFVTRQAKLALCGKYNIVRIEVCEHGIVPGQSSKQKPGNLIQKSDITHVTVRDVGDSLASMHLTQPYKQQQLELEQSESNTPQAAGVCTQTVRLLSEMSLESGYASRMASIESGHGSPEMSSRTRDKRLVSAFAEELQKNQSGPSVG